MAPFIPVPNTVEAHLRGSLNGKPVENTLYFHRSEAWDVTAMTVLAAALGLWYRTQMVVNFSNEYTYVECRLADLTTAFGLVVIDSAGAGTPGSSSFDCSSNQTAFCMRFNTGLRGRSYRGRNYIPAIPENIVDQSKMDAAQAGYLITAYSVLIGYGVLFDAVWSVVSRYAGGAAREYGISTPVISVNYSTLVLASQRGRRPV